MSSHVEKLPEGAIEVKRYDRYKFKNLYFHNEVFYVLIRNKYQKLNVFTSKFYGPSVKTKDVSKRRVQIYFRDFDRSQTGLDLWVILNPEDVE
jgi:hypothetical protein